MNGLTGMGALLAAARGCYFIAVLLLFGEIALSLLIHARLPVILLPRDMRLRWGALAVAAVSAVLWLGLATRQMAGALDLQALGQALSATLFGRIFLVRMAALAALPFFLRRHPKPAGLLALSLFSEWAMIAVLLLVMTGLINGASILLGDAGKPSALYLGVLAAKLVLVAGMLCLAALNRFRLLPQGGDQAILRNAALELGAGVIAALLAGLLGQLQPTL